MLVLRCKCNSSRVQLQAFKITSVYGKSNRFILTYRK